MKKKVLKNWMGYWEGCGTGPDVFFFKFCVSVHHSISQMKHQLDATLCRFYFCRITLHVSGDKRPSSGVFKN